MTRSKSAILFLVALGLVSCEGRKRLSNTYSNFVISPPAATVVKDTPITLTASVGGSTSPNPLWEVSPSSGGVFNPAVGKTVVFTPTMFGDLTIYATSDGQQAQAQIVVVSFIPTSNTFSVYSDAGLPAGTGVLSDIFVGGTMTLAEQTGGYTPEGIKFMRATGNDSPTIGFWGVTLDKNNTGLSKDLAAFATGNLRFSIRLARTMGITEVINVEIDDTVGGPGTGGSVNLNTVSSFSKLTTDWQDVSIPIGSFSPGQVLGTTKVPFAISLQNVTSSLTFDVDAIRWEK